MTESVANARAIELDRRLAGAVKPVHVLAEISWPEAVVDDFLADWRRGSPRLPEPEASQRDLRGVIEDLENIAAQADASDPLQRFVADTATSYATAASMLQVAGTPAFAERSISLYGAPSDPILGSDRTNLSAAEQMLDATAPFSGVADVDEGAYCIPAFQVQRELQEAFAGLFGVAAPSVEVDPQLSSKAAAGATRVRLRGGTCFSELDVQQLIEHEGFVHSATALNGRAQPVLTCMGLSAPRTTKTQEGIATFAELITRSIDVTRLRRLGLRTVAIQRALDGADYVEVFRFFLDNGQTEDESAHSAARVFRGGDVRGSVAFTKDVVYLAGMLAVHGFLRRAISEKQPQLIARLFAGRLTLQDLSALEPAFDDGSVIEGRFVAPWAADLSRLAAYLAFSGVAGWIDIDKIAL